MNESKKTYRFSNFSEAATVLHEAHESNRLHPADAATKTSLDTFFSELEAVQQSIAHEPTEHPIIIAIEALDGTGKTTLTQSLSGLREGVQYISKRTPPDSARHIRSFFDSISDERVTRAYYMVSNYFLQHELRLAVQNQATPTVYIIDRFYASTCAYTLAWESTGPGTSETLDSLPQHHFSWPPDLDPPKLTLILRASECVRKQRVASRSLTTPRTNNPWDERLSRDPDLAARISSALERVSAVGTVCFLDADQPPVAVQCDAQAYINTHVRCFASETTASAAAPNTRGMKTPSKHVRRRPLTVAVTGTHCAGKASIGRRVADVLGEGWRFDQEIGDVERKKEDLVSGGHLKGDGTEDGLHGKVWDEFVFRKERERDSHTWEEEEVGRVVETWHLGNVAWTALRAGGKVDSALLQKTIDAVLEETERTNVIFVHLSIDRDTSVRRHAMPENDKRLPMDAKRVEEECSKLYNMLEVWTLEELKRVAAAKECGNIQLMVVNNSQDGEEAMENVVREVVGFVANKKDSYT